MWPTWKDHKLFTVLLALVLVATTGFLLKKTASLERPEPVEHQISVEGFGKATGKPDIATISFGVESKATDVASAQNANTTTTNALLDQVKAQGVAEDDIQTANYNIREDKTWDPDTNQEKSLGWIVSQDITVKVRDTSKVGALITALGQNGATNISGPTFTIDDSSAIKAEARKDAIEDARKQAATIAKNLGVRLHRVVGYSEWTEEGPISVGGYPLGTGADVFKSTSPTIEAGTNEVSLHVNVTYSLERW